MHLKSYWPLKKLLAQYLQENAFIFIKNLVTEDVHKESSKLCVKHKLVLPVVAALMCSEGIVIINTVLYCIK